MNPARSSAPGFTLLELVVVMGVLGVLLGLGIGYLRSGRTDRDAALATVRGELRRAAVTARSRSLPTEVLVEPGPAGGAATVRARVLEPVGAWHFEPDEPILVPVLRPRIRGRDVPAGRFGHGVRFDPEAEAPVFTLPFDGPLFDLGEGFALRVDLYLEDSVPMTVARIGTSFTLELGGDGRPEVRLVREDRDGRGSGTATLLRGNRAVPLERWCSLEVVHDRQELVCRIDGLEVARDAAPGSLFQQDDDALVLSPSAAPVRGVLDELQLLAYVVGEVQRLPLPVELDGPVRLRFDRTGGPDGPARLTWDLNDGHGPETFRVLPGGILEEVTP